MKSKTSWESVAPWYKHYMGSEGGLLQREVVFPGALRLLDPKPGKRYLDLACGEGAFARLVGKKSAEVVGVDASASLIKAAKTHAVKGLTFFVADAQTFAKQFPTQSFDGMTCILALQNMDPLSPVLRNAAQVLTNGAPFVSVMNHPCFRQPRQSGWGWDEKRKLQYRRVDRYLGSYEMPIEMHPGAAPHVKTFSYHRPLSVYVNELAKHGLLTDAVEEWVSPKKSDSGPRARAENIAREEIPLFFAIRARKIKPPQE